MLGACEVPGTGAVGTSHRSRQVKHGRHPQAIHRLQAWPEILKTSELCWQAASQQGWSWQKCSCSGKAVQGADLCD